MEQTEPGSYDNRFINYRPLFEIAVGLIIGIILSGLLDTAGKIIFGSVFAVGGIILFIIRCRRAALFVCAAAAGALALLIASPKYVPKGGYELNGVVVDCSETKSGTEIILNNVNLNDVPFRGRLIFVCNDKNSSSEKYDIPEIGDGIHTHVTAWTPDKAFGLYNEYRVLASKGIGARAKADSFEIISHDNARFLQFLHKIRSAAVEKANEIFEEDGGMIAALTVGERGEIEEERSDIYRVTGTAHLLAISGFHMGVICAAMGLFLPKGRRWLRFAVMGTGMFIYCLIAVFAPGFVRSAIMTTCILFCSALERRPDSLSALSLSAIILLIINPFQIYSVGFQLSFSACFGIIALNKPVSGFVKKIHFPLAAAVSVTLCASAVTGIFQMRYFGTFSPYLLLGNIVAVPAFSLIMITALIVMAIGFILPSAASFLAVIPRGVLFVTEKYLGLISNFPGAVIKFNSPPVIACISVLAAVFLISPYVLRPFNKRLKYALAAIAVFTVSSILSIIGL